jgi:Tol biopolymer transport system component
MNLWRIAVDQKGKALSDPEPVTSGQGADLHPAISPSGGQLLFCISLANSDVWKLPVDKVTGLSNGPPSAVISTSREDSRGAWSPDEKWIAFNSDRENQNMNLWVHNMENGSERQITRGPGGDYQPNWAPEGTSLVFFSLRSGNADLWSVDIENGEAHGEPRQLTTDRGQDMNPFFSPDGKHIAFMSDRSGRTEIYVMNRDGSDQRRVSSSETGGHFLRWRGNSVVFNTRFNEQWCAAQSSLDGKTEVWIPIKPLPTDPKWAVGGHMSLSPDNSVMMELRNHLELWAVPSNGELPKLVFGFAGGERIDYPVWSPSGNWVLMDRMLSQGSDIYMVEGLE